MFEEDNYNLKLSPRMKACQRQCRLARYKTEGSIDIGNCTCDGPEDCRFQIKTDLADQKFFPDVLKYSIDLFFE